MDVVSLVKDKWLQLTGFSNKEILKETLWAEIIERYSERNRHYHNLSHIASLFDLLEKYVSNLNSAPVVGFAILYHDIIYDTFILNNEEASAAKAEDHLKQLKVKDSVIKSVKAFILATKTHTISEEDELKNDLAFFLDFDLAILGADLKDYEKYSQKIRKEYGQYTDPLFKAGRSQALKQLSEKPSIFITPVFQELFEARAKENINMELQLL